MTSRELAAAEALASTRAEGLEPSKDTLLLVERHVRGEITDAELEAAQDAIVAAATLAPTATR